MLGWWRSFCNGKEKILSGQVAELVAVEEGPTEISHPISGCFPCFQDQLGVGQFLYEQASLRQQLMMMNGRMTHEASRVGTMVPLQKLLEREH